MAWLKRELKFLRQNVAAGAGMVFFRAGAVKRVKVSADQLFLLVLLDVLLSLGLDWIEARPYPEFNVWGFSSIAYGFATLCLIAYLFASMGQSKALLLRLLVCVYSAAPLFSLLQSVMKLVYPELAEQAPGFAMVLWWAHVLWFYSVIGWVMVRLSGVRAHRLRVAVPLAAVVVISIASSSLHVDFFYPGEDTDAQRTRKRVNAEEVFDAQPELLQNAARRIRPGQPGRPALYFLGFASYAEQDVFKKETLYARDLLDNRFGTRGRSLVMVNHTDTAGELPLASGSNLRRALKMLGRKMNREEDVLFVYLTSHGSEKHGLAAQFWPLTLNDIPAEKLKSYLDEAGIKWRVLLISSCYSGRFVDVLKDDHTLVMTASAVNKQSFGCSNARDFTYFGEAVFKDALSQEHSFIPAFQSAITAIQKREVNEKLESSSPQLFIGARIGEKLAALERQWTPVSKNNLRQ